MFWYERNEGLSFVFILRRNFVQGVLVNYFDGCSAPPPLPIPLPPTTPHIALLNGTAPPCGLSIAMNTTLTTLKSTNGLGLILFGNGRDSAVQAAVEFQYPPPLQLPSYFVEQDLGGFLEQVMGSTGNGTRFGYKETRDKDAVAIFVGQPFPDGFSPPQPAGSIVSVGVRIKLQPGSPLQFPPLWKFALVSLGVFAGLALPSLFFLRWRARRMADRRANPSPPATVSRANLAHHPVKLFGEIQSTDLRYVGDPTCSICLEDFTPTTSVRQLVPCGHAFHKECVDRWVVDVAGVCPLCRVDLVGKSGVEVETETVEETRRERLGRRLRGLVPFRRRDRDRNADDVELGNANRRHAEVELQERTVRDSETGLNHPTDVEAESQRPGEESVPYQIVAEGSSSNHPANVEAATQRLEEEDAVPYQIIAGGSESATHTKIDSSQESR